MATTRKELKEQARDTSYVVTGAGQFCCHLLAG